jgi:hypothetical protein
MSKKDIPYPETETPEEQLKTVKRMKKRHPDWIFDICPVCQSWAVVRPYLSGMHTWCHAETRGRRKKTPDKNQGQLI